ncbi:uncharacterized protein G2W53_028585 [Senna tora]|uniref:Retrovirus-related Pol polyprotein from transposon TNT 1-94-like beta-barrel domain-containing protein n=1 Tax=Senna tora TaxID=362788 RepID=A0A834T3I5_9FABA|nr:uncharacterized protein G2W53_028585 [Senna tora]
MVSESYKISIGTEEEQSSNNKELRGQKNAFQELYEWKDPYYIHPSDSTGVHLVTNLLNEITTLWSDADSLVVGWITNAMTKELAEAYIFTPTAKELWKDLKEKYEDADRPQIFNLRKKMNVIEQGNDSLATYSNNLKKILDQIACLRPPPKYSCYKCGAFKEIEEERSDDTVMTFLMGLNESYENVVSNLLMMEPFPAYNRAYSIVSRIEKQKKINMSNTNTNVEASALVAKYLDMQKNLNSGHTEEACFKKHGYPEWFKDYKEKRKATTYANAVNTSSVREAEGKGKKEELDLNSITEFIKKEMQKYGDKESKEPVAETPVNTRYFADFAGMTHDTMTKNNESGACWIIDSGASSHICGDKRLLIDLKVKSGKNTVTLPDGNVKIVKMIGKLSNATGMHVVFDKSSCMVHDLLSDNKDVNWHARLGHPSFESLKHLPFDVSVVETKQYNVNIKESITNANQNVTGFDGQEPHFDPCTSSSLEVVPEVSGARAESLIPQLSDSQDTGIDPPVLKRNS